VTLAVPLRWDRPTPLLLAQPGLRVKTV